MGRTAFLASVGVLGSMLVSSGAYAYTPTVTGGGVPVRWKGDVKLDLAGNPVNRVGVDSGSFRNAVVKSLQRWQQASGGKIGFDYWQGTDAGVYEPDSEYNGLSSIYFVSNAKSDPRLSSNVLGLTQVWYNTDTGEVLETDIVLNDRDFRFTTDPRDTSGYGGSSSGGGGAYSGGRNRVFIENVITHELGHAFGLSHSGGLQSTMLFMESPEQAHLGCDESVAVRALYPADDSGSRGSIEGAVTSESGQGVFGAHVLAISRRRGTVLATAVTDKGGRYRIDALEPGTYFLMVEPFFAGSSALPAYYSGINASICAGGGAFGRSMLMDSSSRPQAVVVPAGGGTGAPTLVARCGSGGGAALTALAGASRSSSAPVVFDGARDGSGFGVADRFGYAGTSSYRLKGVSGRLEVHALGYSLYSPLKPSLSLLDSSGSPVSGARVRVEDPVYEGDSGYVNFDAALVADDLPPGDYVLQVSGTSLDATRYPAGPVSLDSVPFLVVTGSVNEGAPALSSIIPDNSRCLMNESFASYSSPGGNPPRRSTDSEGSGTGFCGTLATVSGHDGDGSGPTPGAMAGWLAPWAAMMLIARLAQAMARASARRAHAVSAVS